MAITHILVQAQGTGAAAPYQGLNYFNTYTGTVIGGIHGWGVNYIDNTSYGYDGTLIEYVQSGAGGSIILDLGSQFNIEKIQYTDNEREKSSSVTNSTSLYTMRWSTDNVTWSTPVQTAFNVYATPFLVDQPINQTFRYIEVISTNVPINHTVGAFRLYY